MLLQNNLKSEICQLMNDQVFNNDSLKSLLNLKSSATIDGLHDKLIRFSIEYKNKLKMLWEEDVHNNGRDSLASKITDFETLFVSQGNDLR